MNRNQLIDNFLSHSYHSLRENDRFMQEQGTKSHFEAFWDSINNAFSMGVKGYHPPNYTVESFYRGTLDVNEFRLQVRETVVDKNLDKLDANIDPILTISWELYSAVISRKLLCNKMPKLCCRKLWGMFNKLDCDSSGFVNIDDIIDVISNIYKANDQEETSENIREWFCDQKKIDFWSFFSALVETHDDLLTPSILQSVYDIIFFEILKEGKMKKKGHKVANWKERWFVLSSTQLCYYESQENRSLKGSVIIGKTSKVDKLNPTKDHPYLFRVTDGKTGVPYDLSAHDPQIMCDWIQKLQVTVGAHFEEGYSTLHKSRLAKNRLFPHLTSSKPSLPAYKQSGVSEYNEGIYRVVQPSKKINQPPPPLGGGTTKSLSFDLPLPPTPRQQPSSVLKKDPSTEQIKKEPNTQPLDSPLPIPTYEAVKSTPRPKIKPYKSDSLLLTYPDNSSSPEPTYINVNTPSDTVSILETDLEPMSPTLPPLTIAQQRTVNGTLGHSDRYINVQHVNVGGQDYALVDKGQAKEDSPPPLPPVQTRHHKGYDDHDYANLPNNCNNGFGESNYSVVETGPIMNGGDIPINTSPSHSQVNKPQPPVAKKRTLKPSKSSPITEQSKPTPNVDSKHLDYTTLDFDNVTEPSGGVKHNPLPKPRNQQIAKARFDYSEVVLEDSTVKDVDKALQLKANRPPPTPPSRYSPSKPNANKPNPILSTSPLRTEFKPPMNSPTQNNNFQYSGHPSTTITATPSTNNIIDLDPPPPPPRRRTSVNKKFNETPPPVPPPR